MPSPSERSRSRHRAAAEPARRVQDEAVPDQELDSYLAALSGAGDDHPTELTSRFGQAQVFQLRLPALRIEQLRRIAMERGVSPGALAVDWVIERLEREDAAPDPASVVGGEDDDEDVDGDRPKWRGLGWLSGR
jgi:hypothetical protein